MRIRTIKPEFFRSTTIAGLSAEAALLFIGLWVVADDQGVGERDPDLLMADLYPKRRDVTDQDVARWYGELEAAGLVESYEGHKLTAAGAVEGARVYGLYRIRSWEAHQSIPKASRPRYEAPPGAPVLFLAEDYRRTTGGLPEDSNPNPTRGITPPVGLPEDYRQEVEVEVEVEKDIGVELGRDEVSDGAPPNGGEAAPSSAPSRIKRWTDKPNPWAGR